MAVKSIHRRGVVVVPIESIFQIVLAKINEYYTCVNVLEQKDVFMQLLIRAAMKSPNHHHRILARLLRVFISFVCSYT